MQEAIDMHVVSLQKLMTEKQELDQHHRAEQRKAEDVRPSILAPTRFCDALSSKIISKWTEQVKLTEKYKSEVSRLEGLLTRKKSELERQGKARSAPTSVKEAQLQGEVDKCMSLLKCSTCRLNLRTTVLTKCMHSGFSLSRKAHRWTSEISSTSVLQAVCGCSNIHEAAEVPSMQPRIRAGGRSAALLPVKR